MREIKFRAWDELMDKMWSWGEILDLNWAVRFMFVLNISKGINLMQYTGLKDKNDKEIYEGDIIKNDMGVGFVEFGTEDGGWRICFADLGEGAKIIGGGWDSCEVIGNIYENPKLLEK